MYFSVPNILTFISKCCLMRNRENHGRFIGLIWFPYVRKSYLHKALVSRQKTTVVGSIQQ